MKTLADVMSKTSWMVFFAGFLTCIVALLRPTMVELLVYFAIDTVALIFTFGSDKKIFLRFFPQYRDLFPEANYDSIAKYDFKEKCVLVHEISLFPRRRALYCIILSIIKVIPAICVVTFYWQHDSTNLVQGSIYVSFLAVVFGYFYGVAYLEAHHFLTKTMADLYGDLEFKSTFAATQFLYEKYSFDPQEIIASLGTVTAIVLTQIAILIRGSNYMIAEASLIALVGVVLIGRIWYLSRKYINSNLREMFESFESFDPDNPRDIQLYSLPLLAKFAQTFNHLVFRIDRFRTELSELSDKKVEESRYQAMGELASLVFHDLSSPLQVIRISFEQVRHNEKYFSERSGRIDRVSRSIDRCEELVGTVRSYLKDTDRAEATCSLGECVDYALTLLSAQVEPEKWQRLTINVAEGLDKIDVKLTKADCTHVILNLIANSADNMLKNDIADPTVNLGRRDSDNANATILTVLDNGTGLKPEVFDKITAIGNVSKNSLGLKLVRRLVENYGGSMSVSNPEGFGTEVAVVFPTPEKASLENLV